MEKDYKQHIYEYFTAKYLQTHIVLADAKSRYFNRLCPVVTLDSTTLAIEYNSNLRVLGCELECNPQPSPEFADFLAECQALDNFNTGHFTIRGTLPNKLYWGDESRDVISFYADYVIDQLNANVGTTKVQFFDRTSGNAKAMFNRLDGNFTSQFKIVIPVLEMFTSIRDTLMENSNKSMAQKLSDQIKG